MKRQNIRKAVILISFILFPLTLYYFSPYLIVEGASKGIITGSFIVFSILFLSSLFLGRIFCGWLCPGGGLMECCMIVNKNRAKGGKRNYIKYMIWLPMVVAVMILLFFNGIKKIDFFYQTQHGISVSEPRVYIIYYAVVFLALILALTAGKRGFCHYVCWMAPFMILGNKIKNIFGWPSLHLEADNSQCTHCQICSKICPMSLDVNDMVKKGTMANDECILCGECVESCPKSVIRYSFKKK